MSEDLWGGIVIAAFAAIVAVVSNAWLARRNKRIEERVRYLTQAYVDLEFGHPRNRPDADERPYSYDELREMDRRFNQAIVAINLFGTPEQVRLCREFPKTEGQDFTALTLSLRNSLRDELGLEKLNVGHFWFEVRRKPELENKE